MLGGDLATEHARRRRSRRLDCVPHKCPTESGARGSDLELVLLEALWETASLTYSSRNYRIVGMTKSAPARMPVGQREVIVLSRV
jgi:hypothetical protein